MSAARKSVAKKEAPVIEQLPAIVQQRTDNTMAIYSSFGDNTLAAINGLGDIFKSCGICGVRNDGTARLLALACMARGLDPFTLADGYDIVEGRLTMKPVEMLRQLRLAGGDYTWIHDGSDGKKATIKIFWRGREFEFTYTIEQAKKAGLIKPRGAWEKSPDVMLRARCSGQGIRAYCPEVTTSYNTDEMEQREPDVQEQPQISVVEGEKNSPAPQTTVMATDAPDPETADYIAAGESIFGGEGSDTLEPRQSEVTNVNRDGYITDLQISEIRSLLSRCNLSVADFDEKVIRPKLGVDNWGDITQDKADRLINGWQGDDGFHDGLKQRAAAAEKS